jgi:hypothetical protein
LERTRETSIQLGENKEDTYGNRWQTRRIRGPNKHLERRRAREREKERKKERKERKKEGHEMETTRTTSTETDNGQGASDEHPVRRKHPERTTATKKEVSKQVENKQRDGRRNRWDTTRVLSPKQPKQRTLSNGSTRETSTETGGKQGELCVPNVPREKNSNR